MSYRAVAMFSGGKGSYAAAKLYVREHGLDGLVLLFTDTNTEDPDLYRFLEEAAEDVGAPLVRLDNGGRTIWDVFRKERMIGNSQRSVCSRALKQRPAAAWVKANAAPDATVIVGIDWTETHRTPAIARNWEPHPVAFPLIEHRVSADALLRAAGITPPRLYAQGFPHNNCAGACVRGGQAAWVLLLETNPAVYLDAERHESELRAELGDVAIIRERRAGGITPLPLSELRRRHELQPALIDRNDLGGCGCFLEVD